jgi:phage terminase small subunit
MDRMEPKRPPNALGPHGRALWRSTLAVYQLTPSEIEILHTLCVTTDQLRRIETAIKGLTRLTANGSSGQLVAHPLLGEHRAHAETVRKLAQEMKLPDIASKTAVVRRGKVNPGRISHLRREGA